MSFTADICTWLITTKFYDSKRFNLIMDETNYIDHSCHCHIIKALLYYIKC